ncbi:hypothetical protein ACQX4M_10810, partial [Corynebacterium diphtheriae]
MRFDDGFHPCDCRRVLINTNIGGYTFGHDQLGSTTKAWSKLHDFFSLHIGGTQHTFGDADGILEDSIMNRSYTNTQKRTALRVYKRTQS